MSNVQAVKEKILEHVQNGDIANLYMLENEIASINNEELSIGYFSNILDLALERLTDTLEAARTMSFEDLQDVATIRALYEYAIEHYSAGTKEDAAALFEVLSGISDNEHFSQSLKYHMVSANEGLSLDEFLDKIADLDSTRESGTFYISAFKDKAQKMLEEK